MLPHPTSPTTTKTLALALWPTAYVPRVPLTTLLFKQQQVNQIFKYKPDAPAVQAPILKSQVVVVEAPTAPTQTLVVTQPSKMPSPEPTKKSIFTIPQPMPAQLEDLEDEMLSSEDNYEDFITPGSKSYTGYKILKLYSERKFYKITKVNPETSRYHTMSICKYRACRQTFFKKTNLIDHLNMHDNVRPFRCSVCQKGFVQKHNWKRHINYCLKKEIQLISVLQEPQHE